MFLLNCKDDSSLQLSPSRPHQIARRLKEVGSKGAAITNISSISSVPKFFKAFQLVCKCGYQPENHDKGKGKCLIKGSNCAGYEKEPLKAVFGCEINTVSEGGIYSLIILAKNLAGWQELIQIVSKTYEHGYKPYDAKIDLSLLPRSQNLIYISGYEGSIYDTIFEDVEAAQQANSIEECAKFLRKDYAEYFKKIGGFCTFPNFYLGVSGLNDPYSSVLQKVVRWGAKKNGMQVLAFPSSFYCKKEDASDQRVLVACSVNATLEQAPSRCNWNLGRFFQSNSYYMLNQEEQQERFTQDEIDLTVEIASAIETYDITSPPIVPEFPIPEGFTPKSYLEYLCREGWKKKCGHIPKEKYKDYADRIKTELKVIGGYKILTDYFLIVQDYMKWARERMICGPGRGSASGCMISYLLDITDIDSVLYDLSFERFFNSSRLRPAHVSFDEYPFEKFSEDYKLLHYAVVADSKYIREEWATLENDRVSQYYQYVCDNVELDRSNSQNSHLMHFWGKVDKLDKDRPAKILPAKSSLPDIDCDFPKHNRADVIDYVAEKLGRDKVAYMATFGRMQGRSALKDVLRAYSACSAEEANKITESIPDEQAITDQLQEMMEEDGESSIIMWALKNNKKELEQWCKLDEDGTISGPLGKRVEQAVRLEGVKRSMGKHPSGIIVSPKPLSQVAPTISKGDFPCLAVDMVTAEMYGTMKLDILGITNLDKLQYVKELLKNERYPDVPRY